MSRMSRKDKIEIYRDQAGCWRWRFVAGNGAVLADGGSGYSDKRDCIHGMSRVLGGHYERLYAIPGYQQGQLVRPRSGFMEQVFVEVIA